MGFSQRHWSAEYRLSLISQVFFGVANLLLGVLPSALIFFLWVERNCHLPGLWDLGIRMRLDSLIQIGVWDFLLFLLFGEIHSEFAPNVVHSKVEKVCPPQVIRTLYLCVTGVSLFLLMLAWQPTGVVLWRMPLPESWEWLISFLLFWGFMIPAGKLLSRFGIFEFIGIKQLVLKTCELKRTEGTGNLIVEGLYHWVRHPVYTLTLAAFLLTPYMTLDRMLVFLATCTYLCVGIPIEEKKLVKHFGQAYLSYKKRTPALLPSILQ